MTTIDILLCSSLDKHMGSLRNQFTLAGFITRETKGGIDKKRLQDLPHRLPEIGVDVVVILQGDTWALPLETRLVLHDVIKDRYLGVEEELRNNCSPYLQSFVGRLGEVFVFALPIYQNSITTLLQALKKLPASEVEVLDQPTTVVETETTAIQEIDDFEDDGLTEIEPIHIIPAKKKSSPQPTPLASGWQAGLKALQGSLQNQLWSKPPEALVEIAAVKNILDTAGSRKTVTLPSGKKYTLYGFPDLLRPHSKALLIAEDDSLGEVIALHRTPRKVGIVSRNGSGWLPSKTDTINTQCQHTIGPHPNPQGVLFAVEPRKIYIQRNNSIYCWDGSKETSMGTIKQCLASLLLRWTQQ